MNRLSSTFCKVMRLYWPKEEPPSILPAGEGHGNQQPWRKWSSNLFVTTCEEHLRIALKEIIDLEVA